MEQGKSSSNPDAAPFIPFHEQEANKKNEISELMEGSSKSSDIMRTGHENLSDQMGEQYGDEDSQMDIAYLTHMFPDIPEKFVVDVYSVNGRDIEDTVDMLKQLPCFPSALPKCQPGSLDTNEDLECEVKAEGSSLTPQSSDSSEAGASFQWSLSSAL